jgi:hypothetical protein
MEHNIATVINYCSNDYRWIKPCIEHVLPFSKQVVIPVCDHYFNGEEEDRELLDKSYKENPEAVFIEFEYNPEAYKDFNIQRYNDPFQPNRYLMNIDSKEIWFWHQMQRLTGFKSVDDDIEYVLFLDTDEIIDYDRFINWLNNFPYHDYNAIRFETYWYFRDLKFRALQTEDWNGITLVKKSELSDEAFFLHDSERLNFINFVNGNKYIKMMGLDGKPMIHHYSWVRTKEEMLKKVRTWGHARDKDWTPDVNREFSREFIPGQHKDFVHGYDFITVEPFIKTENK